MTDSVDTISAATGISRADMLEIWEGVKANHAALDACRRHDFRPDAVRPRIRYRCGACGGTISSGEHFWYQRGLAHAQVPT